MFIKNATYKSIPTEGLSFPLAEGTIISGGIVPETAALAPPTGRVYIAVGGTIDLSSPANKNVSFTDEQIRALGGDFNFVPAEEAKSELPAVSVADAGKVVAVNETGTEYELVESGSGLPPYTSADIGKVFAVVEDTEHQVEQTIIPEQNITLTDSYGMSAYLFGDDDGVNKSFFQNASVGDKCTITIDDGSPVESTAETVYGEILFPVGDYYVGSATLFGGTGVATLNPEASKNIIIRATAVASGTTAGVIKSPFIVTLFNYDQTPTIDKTYAEIMNAYKNLVPIFFKKEDNSLINFYSNIKFLSGQDSFEGCFWEISYSGDTPVLSYLTATITENGVTVDDVAYVEMTSAT